MNSSRGRRKPFLRPGMPKRVPCSSWGRYLKLPPRSKWAMGATGSVEFTYLRVGTRACCGPDESSSSVAESSGSETPESSAVVPELSSAAPTSSDVLVESSSSVTQELKPAANSSESTTALPQMTRVGSSDRNLVVFDMQGRVLGQVTVPAGMTENGAIFAKFGKSGIYMVQSDGVFRVLSVTK